MRHAYHKHSAGVAISFGPSAGPVRGSHESCNTTGYAVLVVHTLLVGVLVGRNVVFVVHTPVDAV